MQERNVHEVSGKQTEGYIYEHSAVISEVAGIPCGDRQSLVATEDHHDWVFAVHRQETIAAFGREGLSDILLDSGVYVQVCPQDYRSEIDLERAESEFSLHSVTGNQLNIYGRRIVWYTVGDDQGLPVNLSVTYVVCDARRPIVITASLVDRGCRVELGGRSCIEWAGRRVPLRRVGNTFVLTYQP